MPKFWEKVTKTDGCWLWTGSLTHDGYGRVDKTTKAHRYSWRLHFGVIPNGKHVLHKCDTRNCVRPEHLWVGTHQDNMTDREMKGRGIRGERVGISRLTADDVREIRACYPKLSQYALAKRYGVSPSTIYYAATGVTWRHV